MLPEEIQACLMLCVINLNYILYNEMKDEETRREKAQQVEAEEDEDGPQRKKRRKYPKHQQPPRFWCRPWNSADRRLMFGHWDNLVQEMRIEDTDSFFNLLRMQPELFEEIHDKVKDNIQAEDTAYRRPLPSGLKLAATLRHLSTGELYPSIAYQFRISRHTVTKIVPKVCKAIYDALCDEVMQCPQDPDAWREVASLFHSRWNVPHAVGAVDGKHIQIRKPGDSGSLYYNYKGFFSIVLMAVVDADYKFLWADIGGMGHQSDAQIFNDCEFKECLEESALNLPQPDPLPHDDQNMPYYLLGDDAFGLTPHLMKPYPQRGLTRAQRIFNNRISRGRRVV